MGFFSTILEKLGIKKDEPAPTPVSAPAKIVASERPAGPLAAGQAAAAAKAAADKAAADKAAADKAAAASTAAAAAAAAAAPKAISVVDVVKKLEDLSVGSELDWKVSIVDLLKVLGIDSSREARNELATELGCPADLMKDSAKMNVWLHKEVLRKVAENGGNIPQTLLD
ncbi:MAG: DUF3597 domain-containing protein [Anaerolineales bacterium]|jgi:hypothetical protein|uniref:DUF3597 domain-containing protein n=1 Tax=Candidatus Villigracilis affinis TaxID=3140682 RepID=UPI001D5D6DBB|nr:DUF3597 domain-containing protein [Anaerolineales bacterium]MBK9601812.1 DUF3597 domain-containing protein [Anaerolineales bacterium]MBL0344682.1 DUF3597 domain-containing protein [Anaerolineales bacterium]